MSIKLTKDLSINRVCADYGVVISSETVSCDLIFTVEGVTISGTSGEATVGLTVAGVSVGNKLTYDFTYDSSAGDVVQQVENYMLTLSDFSGATTA